MHDFTMIRYHRVLLAAKTPVRTSVSKSFIVIFGHQHHSCSQTNKASSHRWSDFRTQVHCWWKQVRALCSMVSISKASVLRSWAEWLFGQRFLVMKFSSCYTSGGQQMWRGRCGLLSCLVSDVFFGNSPPERTRCVCSCVFRGLVSSSCPCHTPVHPLRGAHCKVIKSYWIALSG